MPVVKAPKETPPALLAAEEQAAKRAFEASQNSDSLTRKICRKCLYQWRNGERNTKPPQFPVDTDPAVMCPVCGGTLEETIPL